MDQYSGKRAARGLSIPRKGSGPVLRDAAESKDQDEQFCNRLGCNGRIKYAKSAQNGSSEKFKSSRPSSHTSSGKEVITSSTRASSVLANTRKSFLQSRKKLNSQLELNSCEADSVQDEPEVVEADPSSGRAKIGQKPSVPLAPKSTCKGPRNSGSASLRNLRCNSISGVVPSGCSSFESNVRRRKDTAKERNAEVESSSLFVRGRKTSEPLSKNNRSFTSTHGISISDSRRARNGLTSQSNVVGSDQARRSVNGNARTRLSNCGYGNRLLPKEFPVVTSQVPRRESPIAVDVFRSSSSGNSNSSPDIMRAGQNFTTDLGITCSIMNHDEVWRNNMDGNAEERLSLALERLEDAELTYEQLHALETNTFYGGLGFYDQHQDLRLDIDNMSYEELLALEEKMGTVSTALSEEALSKCLERTTYQPPEGAMECSGNDNEGKCSICQEEYIIGDEVGRLECKHGYHTVCIHEWLRLKNWCPICKASAALPSQSSSSSSLYS
ncbi:hypothetical protein U1Q18_018464 [Sarracenia purpurea var. burkii]